MKKHLIFLLFPLLVISCDTEHKGQTIKAFTGDYRYHKGIAEFFDCRDRHKYYVAPSGKHKEVQDKYLALKLKDNDDAYIKVEGYVKNEELMDSITSVDVFVITKLLDMDQTRGCSEARRAGN